MAYTTIDDPLQYFNTVLYTGDGGSQNITGVGFAPDWVWLKGRNNANNHNLNDTVRGVNKQVYADLTNAETTATTHLTAFDSDGFTLGNDGAVNGNSDTYVAFNWYTGATASANGNGSISSSVSANTTAGFSIVSYTGNGTLGATVGHGLGSAPSMILVKRRDTTGNWWTYHSSLGGADKYIVLNSTSAAGTSTNIWNNTAPTSSVFSLGDNSSYPEVNGTSNTFIAYCFAEKKGYSKFGIYRGNGNSVGPYVHCGFKPAWVLQKNISATQGWQLQDNKRNGFNGANKLLQPHTSQTESDVNRIDILSNGFRVITTDAGQNTNGSDYIYIAFAKSPYVSSTGVPTNAR